MQIDLTDDRKALFRGQLQSLFREDFDEELSDFRANEILDLAIKTLCPDVYNQAVQDVRAHLQVKLDDLNGEVYVDG
ncbi:DUF2164 domain-containing protein [Pelagibius sp. Alg239-R121]|uniref:DUF2164 domain-containing protein n=1 Tax=Pelagibius sp. Alg239-R121 TaxID=2993448 RepID=UPI0024A722F1|nr:DUF2164 domain-containing protein [Pelagibius sp. Alg239-R121]